MTETDWVLAHTRATALRQCTLLQNLWGGYGQLLRITLEGAPSVILKRVVPPDQARETASDRRKRQSYKIEKNWYRGPARNCHSQCRVAACVAILEPSLLLLEDLQNAGYLPTRPPQLRAGLRWLAHFHAQFLGQTPPGLWDQGSYWHLATRQDEWQRMPPGPLKDHAAALDARLRAARYQTLLHGDAKPSNFLWHPDGTAAAVDFQYVGPGCGIRDVAYFLDCCLDETGCQDQAEQWLQFYFKELRQALQPFPDDLEQEWRALYPVAWADYCRFYQGWGHPGPLGAYSQRQLQQALKVGKL